MMQPAPSETTKPRRFNEKGRLASWGDSDGCPGSSLFNVMRAIDDDGDGTANGTPHAEGIWSALSAHNIACGAEDDTANQDQSSCPALGTATLTGAGANNSAELSWTPVASASRYFIYRSDISCDSSYTRVGEVTAPTTSFVDTTVVNGLNYYFVVQAVGASDACTGLVSNCELVTPVPCETPDTPTGLVAIRYCLTTLVSVSANTSTCAFIGRLCPGMLLKTSVWCPAGTP